MKKKSSLMIIFTTIFLDLIGFGMVIPLISIYGRHYGASGVTLAILGGCFSMMQFIFAPFWGRLSDRYGRRPIILFSLFGSTVSYFMFGFADSLAWLIASRIFGGICAANISTAQAYIADSTSPEDRAKGMGLIGAAFGIGFTLGPPLGGIAAAKFGMSAPGLIAGTLCGLNFLAASIRLPESLKPENRAVTLRRYTPLNIDAFRKAWNQPLLWPLLMIFFFSVFAFSTMEQTFSLLFQTKFLLTTENAGKATGFVLMWAGVIGVIIQGGLIRKLVPKFGELKLLRIGLVLNCIGMFFFPLGPSMTSYFAFMIPIAIGSALINPTISALISKNAQANEQGAVLGLSQGLGSLARAFGPFLGLITFGILPHIPFWIASVMVLGVLFFLQLRFMRMKAPLNTPKEQTDEQICCTSSKAVPLSSYVQGNYPGN